MNNITQEIRTQEIDRTQGLNQTAEMEARLSILEELRKDVALNQKCGLPFILASVLIWIMIAVVTGLKLDITLKNTIVFCCSCPLMPLAWLFGKLLKVNIFDKTNPLGKLGFTFTMNQMIYLLIVMWVFKSSPENMVMVYAMVFGAHFLPYSWLYKTKAYLVAAIVIPFVALFAGQRFGAHGVAIAIAICEVVFAFVLTISSRKR